MSQRKNSILHCILLLFTAIIWGFGFIAVKNTLDSVTTLYLLAFRFTIGTLGLCIVFHRKLRLIKFCHVKQGMLLGGFLFLAFYFQIDALKYTTVGKNAFLTAAYVVLVPFFCWLIRKQRLKLNCFAATIICLAGIALLSLDSNLTINLGDALTLICSVFYALHIVFSDMAIAKKYDPIILTMLQITFAAAYAWIFAPFFEPFPTAMFQSEAVIGILYLGIFCTMLGFLFQMLGQRHTSPAAASLLLSTESVFGCFFSVILLGEHLTAKMIVGCLFIFISIIISDIGIDFSALKSKLAAKTKVK